MQQQRIQQLRYVTLVNLLALFLVVVTLAIVSLASLLQTIRAFSNMADPTLPMFGMFLPIAYGVLFQYGQNAALYIRQYYCDDVPLLRLGDVVITSRNLAMGVFFVCAFVDGFTNVLWFYRSVEMTGDKFTDYLVMIIGYPCMVLIVFAEEVFGRVLQALRRVKNEYRSIKERERASRAIDDARNGQSYYTPVQRQALHTAPRPAPQEPHYEDLG